MERVIDNYDFFGYDGIYRTRNLRLSKKEEVC